MSSYLNHKSREDPSVLKTLKRSYSTCFGGARQGVQGQYASSRRDSHIFGEFLFKTWGLMEAM